MLFRLVPSACVFGLRGMDTRSDQVKGLYCGDTGVSPGPSVSLPVDRLSDYIMKILVIESVWGTLVPKCSPDSDVILPAALGTPNITPTLQGRYPRQRAFT